LDAFAFAFAFAFFSESEKPGMDAVASRLCIAAAASEAFVSKSRARDS
jgi:hypothetical protein